MVDKSFRNHKMLQYVAKQIKSKFPNVKVYDTQSHKLEVGDFYVEIMSADRDNKLHNNYVERFMQDTSIRVIYYCGQNANTPRTLEVEDFLLDSLQWMEVEGRRTRARDVQCTYSMNKDTNCMVCVAKYYTPLIRYKEDADNYMVNKIDTNIVEEAKENE